MKRKILVVGENRDHLEELEATFKAGGHDVAATDNGLSAGKYSKTEFYDLICASAKTTQVSGLDLILALRDGFFNGSTPIFFIVDNPDAVRTTYGNSEGVHLIPRSISSSDLALMADHFLDSGKLEMPTPTKTVTPPASHHDHEIKFVRPFIEAVESAIKSICRVTSATSDELKVSEMGPDEVYDYSGTFAIQSPQLLGHMTISFSESAFHSLVPERDPSHQVEIVVANLSKLIFERVREHLQKKGIAFAKAHPYIVAGPAHRIHYGAGGLNFSTHISTERGDILMQLYLMKS